MPIRMWVFVILGAVWAIVTPGGCAALATEQGNLPEITPSQDVIELDQNGSAILSEGGWLMQNVVPTGVTCDVQLPTNVEETWTNDGPVLHVLNGPATVHVSCEGRSASGLVRFLAYTMPLD